MAVEIPVVIDIEQAFKDAAAKVPSAIKPLMSSLEKLKEDLMYYKDFMSTESTGSPMFAAAAKKAQELERDIALVNDRIKQLGTNDGSLNRLSVDLESIQRRFAEMGSKQMFDSSGKWSQDAIQLQKDYTNVRTELDKILGFLTKEYEEQRRLTIEAQKQAEAERRKEEETQKENELLRQQASTIHQLQQQERILTERMSKATIGSAEFRNYAASLQQVRTRLAEVRKEYDSTASSQKKIVSSTNSARAAMDTHTASMRRQSAILSQLKSLATMYLSVFGGLRFLKNIRETTAELELQRVSLGGILQDTEKATELFRQIKAAALKSPFEIKDLVTYTKQLAAYRIETDKLFDVTMKLADVSAGLGVDMNRLILAYGQVRAASVLRGQELRQFTEAGIPLVDELARKFRELGREGTTTADVFELISKRAVPFSMIESIFDDMTKAGGIFYNMQERQSETLKGKWMKLKDACTIMYDEIGNTDGVHQALVDLIDDALALTRAWRDVAKFVEVVTASIITYSIVARSATVASAALTKAEAIRFALAKKQVVVMPALIAKIVGETAAKKADTWATRQLTAAQVRLAMANNLLSKSFWKVVVAIMSNPYAAAAAGIAALVTGIVVLIKKANEAKFSIEKFEQAISEFDSSAKKAKSAEDLVSVYEELSSKADRTAEDQEKLIRVTKELAKTFPEAVAGVDAETGALQINIDKVKELTEAEKQLMRTALENDKKQAEAREKEILKRRKEIDDELKQGGKKQKVYGGEQILPFSQKQISSMREELLGLLDELDRVQTAIKEAQDRLDGIEKGSGNTDDTTDTLNTWKQKIKDIQDEKMAAGATEMFTKDEIQKFESVLKFSKELKKKIDEITQSLTTNRELLKSATEETKQSIQDDIEADEKTLEMLNAIKLALGIIFKQSGSTRDDRLSILKGEISEITNAYKKYLELVKYMSKEKALKEIDTLFPQLKGWEPTFDNTINKLKSKLMDVQSQLARNPKSKVLLDMQRALETEISNLSFEKMKTEMDKKLKRLTEEIKRSETARNFFNNVLGLVGDEKLAASLSVAVYGGIGDEFKKRMQEQLDGALESLKVSEGFNISEDLEKAFKDMDFEKILSIENLPEEVERVVREAYESSQKYDADLLENFANLINKYGDTSQKIATITATAANEIQRVKDALEMTIANGDLSDEEKAALRKRADAIIKALEGERDLDIFKQSDDYINFFSEINVMTAEQAATVRGELRNAYLKAFHDGAISADELRRNLRSVDEQFKKLTEHTSLLGAYLSGGFQGGTEKLQEFADMLTVIGAKMEGGKQLNGDEQNFITKMLQQFNGLGENTKGIKSYTQLIEAFSSKGGMQAAGKAIGQMGQGMSAMAAKGPGALAIVDAIFQAVHSTITSIQQMIDELNRMRSEENKVGEWFKFVSDFDKYTYSGWEKLKSGDVIGATADAVSSYISIFNNIQEIKVKKINEDIKEQRELIEDLQYSYGRLQKAIEESFGAEYIYNFNEQLKMLKAEAEAYRKQAELERSKGKSAEEDVAKEFEKQARDVEDTITDMQAQLAEFFAGTSLTSAAEDFANAWIEAYSEFASTTDAMSEKFQDMIQSMITKSLAAKIMQEMLAPVFDQIDSLSRDGVLSMQEISDISELAQSRIPLINDAMTSLMASLASAGYDVRNNTAGLSGISKSIASASEESILGLAAGINTQNFYMSYMPVISENVAQILSYISGGASAPEMNGGETVGEVMPSIQRMVYDHLPRIDQNIDDMLRAFKSVIVAKNGQNRVAVN